MPSSATSNTTMATTMSDGNRFGPAADAIRAATNLALTCHVGPDGDALGSMLGFALAARNAQKKVVASFGSPFVVPENLSFLATEGLVPPADFPASPEVMVVFDVGVPDRLGELASNAHRAGTLIVLDHHVTSGGFGDIPVVVPDAAATGVLVAGLLEELGWPLTPEIATCLHTALVTDTGRFQYASTSASVMRLAATLIAAGADIQMINRKVYEEAPFGYLKVAGVGLARARLDADLSLVSTYVTERDLDDAGVDWGDIDNLMDTLRLAEEADTAVLAKVSGDGSVKLSLRSRGGTDVGGLAASLGGGGHRLASGVTMKVTAEAAIDEVRARIRDYR
jgi:bifunctional oligoribonuclease and PAP phosphatase NrnA